jgi:hypothetical protein
MTSSYSALAVPVSAIKTLMMTARFLLFLLACIMLERRTPARCWRFHIIGLSRDKARQEVMRTYIQLRTELIAKIVGAKPLEDRIAVAAYIIVSWYHYRA